MFKIFRKNKVGQNTAEYALLIALVVAGIIAMQTYAQRSLQARMRGAAQYLSKKTSSQDVAIRDALTSAGGSDVGVTMGGTMQYEPYYLQSKYVTNHTSGESTVMNEETVHKDSFSNRTRDIGGHQTSTYSGTYDGTQAGSPSVSGI